MGESVLNEMYPDGFRHNEQSLRVVDLLENGGRGLNLTYEVREGILKHSKTGVGILGDDWGTVNTLEGQVVKISDIVAYINHDVDDAIRAGLITGEDLPLSITKVLGQTRSERINALVCDIINSSWSATGDGESDPVIGMSSVVKDAAEALRVFLFERVYRAAPVMKEGTRVAEVVRILYHYFVEHPDLLRLEYVLQDDPIERRVVDYIAGMTDQYALRLIQRIDPSECWSVLQMPNSRF
jgi:dGTPase